MPRVLIAISSCQSYEDEGLNQPMRETWLPEAVALGMDYRFFYGRNARPRHDVIITDSNDAYYDLTTKYKEKIKWALLQEYDYMFSCLADCYAAAERLVKCGFEKYDYFGNVFCHPKGKPYCQGGPGYFLSRKAMVILDQTASNYPNDDCWTGDALCGQSINVGDSKDFVWMGHIDGPKRGNSYVTAHLSNAKDGYRPELMHKAHREWKTQ